MQESFICRVITLAVVLSVTSTSRGDEPVNLVRNPSFERDVDRDDRPDAWSGPALPDGSTGAVFLDRALPMNGSVQVSVVFMEEGLHTLTQPVKLKPSTQYTLGCWIRGHAARGNAWVRFTQTEPLRQQWESRRAPQGHSDWTLYNTTFTTPDDHGAGQIEICWGLSLQGMFRFDFVSLVEGDKSPDPPNTAPRLRQDRFDVQRGALFSTAAPGVLKNDEDAEGDELSVIGFSQTQHGEITVRGDGSLTYRPQADFTGEDSFEYRASDGRGGEATTLVTLNVADLPSPANLLTNVSFETEDHATRGPKGWTASASGTISVDSTASRSGRRSLRIDANGSPQSVRQSELPFRKGRHYRLTAWAKGDAVAGGGLRFYYAHPDGRRRWHTTELSGTFDWQRVEMEFAHAREQIEGGSIDIVARCESGRIWVDDVVVEEFPLPYRVFIDGYSVTGGVVPILEELGNDALRKGITDRAISVTRSPAGDRSHIRNTMPYDVALLCSWALQPKDKDFMGETDRKAGWKRWFAAADPETRVMLFHWQPCGLSQWPEGFTQLADDYAKVAADVGVPIVPTTLAFRTLAGNAADAKAMLRKLYSADYHHAGRVGNYVKACCAFAAVTGKSPVGLTHILPIDIDFGWPPETLSRAEARVMQQAAWDAWRTANVRLR